MFWELIFKFFNLHFGMIFRYFNKIVSRNISCRLILSIRIRILLLSVDFIKLLFCLENCRMILVKHIGLFYNDSTFLVPLLNFLDFLSFLVQTLNSLMNIASFTILCCYIYRILLATIIYLLRCLILNI